MVTEDFCSFELAKLLKEKGFDEVCYRLYNTEEKELWGTDGIAFVNHEADEDTIAAPTHQMVLKWCREKGYYIYFPPGLNRFEDDAYIPHIVRRYGVSAIGTHKGYYNAVEYAIKYVLENLI